MENMFFSLLLFLNMYIAFSANVKFDSRESVIFKINDGFISGLTQDLNLCKVFQPPLLSIGHFWMEMKPLLSTNQHVRFMVLHQCQKPTVEGIFNNFLQKAFECEDSNYAQVTAMPFFSFDQ